MHLVQKVPVITVYRSDTIILRAFFARSPGVSMVMFRYYLLGGDTAAPSGLYTL